MKKLSCSILVAAVIAAVIAAGSAQAASNFVPGPMSESQVITGPVTFGGGLGDALNTSANATFTGGFVATTFTWEGELTQAGGVAATWASEATVNITDPGANVLGGVGTAGPEAVYTPPLPFANTVGLPISVDPVGTWSLEFFEDYDDDAALPDQFSVGDITITFATLGSDSDASENAGVLGLGGTFNSVGEFGFSGLLDSYTISLSDGGQFSAVTSSDPGGLIGSDSDTEIGLFNSSGVLLAANDDLGGGSLFSAVGDYLPAGDYTVLVGSFDSNFDDLTIGASTIGEAFGGGGLGDYAITFGLVPEPSATSLLIFGLAGIALRRRR